MQVAEPLPPLRMLRRTASPPLRCDELATGLRDLAVLDEAPRCRQQRSRAVDRRARRRTAELVVAVDRRASASHRCRSASSACGCAKSTQLRSGRDERMPVRVRLHVDQAGLDAAAHFLPGHEQVVFGPGRRRHPVRRHEQHGPGVEGPQQRHRHGPETLACVVEREQHGAGRPAAAVAGGQVFLQAQGPVAVAVQELQVAREHLRFHVVIREDRNFAARQRQAEDESGVPCSRDAGGGAQQATDIVHGQGNFMGSACRHGRPCTKLAHASRSSMY